MSSGSCNSFRGRERNGGYCSNGQGHNHPFVCHCGLAVKVQTSWTELNPGRRFVSCPTRGQAKCNFFYWCDAEICDRAKNIIPGLLKKTCALNSRVAAQELQIKKWKLLAFCTSLLLVMTIILCVV